MDGEAKAKPWDTVSTEDRSPVELESLPSQLHQTTLQRECFSLFNFSTKETTGVTWVRENIKKELTNLIIVRAGLPTDTNQR